MRKFRWMMMLLMAATLSFVSCDEPVDTPKPGGGTESLFDVEIAEVTKTSMTFNVTPSDLEAEYFCFVYDKVSADDFTRDQYLVSAIYEEVRVEAEAKGMTFQEYLPTILDKGVIEGGRFEGLMADTDYYLIIFNVDAANNFKASDKILKMEFRTATVEMSECTFEVTVRVKDNNVEFDVFPSDPETPWHLISVPTAMYDYYVSSAEGPQMTDDYFYQYYFNNEISQYRQAGYTDEQIMQMAIPTGNQTLGAKGLTANTEYLWLIAGLAIDADGLWVSTPISKGSYRTGNAAKSDLSFEISITDITDTRAAVKVTPSNNNETFCWMIAEWDGVSTAEQVMNEIVAMYGGYMNQGMMLYRGVQDYTGKGSSSYKFKLDAPDTDYYCVVFGFSGGVTTDPVMQTFRTLPGPNPEDVVFNMTASNLTPYSVDVNVSVSSESIYYTASMMDPAQWDEAKLVADFNENFDFLLEESQKFDPNTTVAQVLSSYYWRGSQQLQARGLYPETELMGFVVVLDTKTGHVARVVTYPGIATTLAVGSVTPSVEVLGYYSGDEEAGSIFGQPAATKGKAIVVTTYHNFDGARGLFTSLVEGDVSNSVGFDDTTLWDLALGFWNSCKVQSPYTFYVAEWNTDMTAIVYATDAQGVPGGIGRAFVCAVADEKGSIDELREIYEIASAAEKANVAMPMSLVVREEPMVRPAAMPAEREVVAEEPMTIEADKVEAEGYRVMQLDYVRTFYLHR